MISVAALCSMLLHASPEFLRRHIPAILAGDELWAQFFSEPGAGSDLAGVTTRAERDGDRWILSGSKIWSSGAYYADYGMCLARTNWDVPKHRGLTVFMLPIRRANSIVATCRNRGANSSSTICQYPSFTSSNAIFVSLAIWRSGIVITLPSCSSRGVPQ